jgi:hypothetical protein
VALGQVFLRALWLFPVSIIPPLLHIHWSSGGRIKGPLGTQFQGDIMSLRRNNYNSNKTPWIMQFFFKLGNVSWDCGYEILVKRSCKFYSEARRTQITQRKQQNIRSN